MKRYITTKKGIRYDGKQVYVTTYYPNIPDSDQDIIIIAGQSDYLDTLANKYYDDPTLWWVIAVANNIGKGRLSVTPGLQLRIPANIRNILEKFKILNSR